MASKCTFVKIFGFLPAQEDISRVEQGERHQRPRHADGGCFVASRVGQTPQPSACAAARRIGISLAGPCHGGSLLCAYLREHGTIDRVCGGGCRVLLCFNGVVAAVAVCHRLARLPLYCRGGYLLRGQVCIILGRKGLRMGYTPPADTCSRVPASEWMVWLFGAVYVPPPNDCTRASDRRRAHTGTEERPAGKKSV